MWFMKATMVLLTALIVGVIIGIISSLSVKADTVIYPTIPGTSYRDYSQPGILIEQEGNQRVYYKTIPGTDYKDYSQPGWVVEGDSVPIIVPDTTYRGYHRGGRR
jgi:hypothetical protein